MKTIQKNNNKILLIAACVTLCCAVVGVTAWALQSQSSPAATSEEQVNLGTPSEDEKTTGNTIKEGSLDQSSNGSQNSGSDPLPPPKPNDSGEGLTVDAEITSVNKSEENLIIRTLIQTISASGTCTISLSGPNSASYSATAEVQALPNGTTCKGFDIPLSQLSSGKWLIELTYSNDNIKARTTKEITI